MYSNSSIAVQYGVTTAVAQPRIFFGRGQSITSSVTDVFLTVDIKHQ